MIFHREIIRTIPQHITCTLKASLKETSRTNLRRQRLRMDRWEIEYKYMSRQCFNQQSPTMISLLFESNRFTLNSIPTCNQFSKPAFLQALQPPLAFINLHLRQCQMDTTTKPT